MGVVGKTILTLLGLAAIVLAAIYAFMVFAFLESSDISKRGLTKYLVIPRTIRNLEPIKQCAPLRYIRRYQECGGICGEYVGLGFGTTATMAELKAAYDIEAIRTAIGADEVDMHFKEFANETTCRTVYLDAYTDFVDAPPAD